MSRPDLTNIWPPSNLVQQWWAGEGMPPAREFASMVAAYRAGAQLRAEQLAGQWPELITDRLPTQADGDENGYVQSTADHGYWCVYSWEFVRVKGWPWLHTPQWQPPAPLTPEQQEALAALDRLLQHCSDNTGEAALRRFILREAGE